MNVSSIALAFAAGVALAAPAFAQTTDTWRMPHERGFWGHAGVSWGHGELDAECPAGFDCDRKDSRIWRAYVGGRFNNAIGLELGALNIGDYTRGGGTTDGWGVDASLVAGIPIGANSAIFAKVGAIYARTEATGDAPGFTTGKERGFGGRYGVGAQLGLTPQWALRADWDRYNLPLPGGKDDLDTLTIGVQYTFR